jgi:hypothetical protein
MSDYTEYFEYYKKAWEKSLSERTSELQAENARLREALQLIATPVRSDGTYNRSREACEQLAREALRGDITPDKGGE